MQPDHLHTLRNNDYIWTTCADVRLLISRRCRGCCGCCCCGYGCSTMCRLTMGRHYAKSAELMSRHRRRSNDALPPPCLSSSLSLSLSLTLLFVLFSFRHECPWKYAIRKKKEKSNERKPPKRSIKTIYKPALGGKNQQTNQPPPPTPFPPTSGRTGRA